MSYDTDHVRNAGSDPEAITGIRAFTELVDNAALAGVYTQIREMTTATGPELVAKADVSKKTVYEYLRKLADAGLITAVGEEGNATTYAAEEFEMTLTVRDVTVSITPDLVEVLAQREAYPVIDRVLERDGLLTFALVHDLVTAHSDGEVTIRQIADLTGLSSGTTYDIVEALYDARDLGDEEGPYTTYTPEEIGNEESTGGQPNDSR